MTILQLFTTLTSKIDMLRTNKAVAKRVKISKKGKLSRRPLKQNHFKSKLTGEQNQKKRRLLGFSKVDEKVIKSFIPHGNGRR